MKQLIAYPLVALAAIGVSACGSTPGDRALSGAGLGAAAGTVGTVVTGGNPLTGALIGAGVGAAAGAVTNEDQVNFGKPIWKK
ncbi:MAG: hypothetical protein COY40_02255 [Alphaproteobacteria bacterium CG_4_10_14_0_8_um_filter_53_9]|nr:MAG: hypothetical protein COY40_02255 [Alphaproteobacteria bacterium CG_4_10_14_0_8_um_filter_53_9]